MQMVSNYLTIPITARSARCFSHAVNQTSVTGQSRDASVASSSSFFGAVVSLIWQHDALIRLPRLPLITHLFANPGNRNGNPDPGPDKWHAPA